jgi:hypothetical protein
MIEWFVRFPKVTSKCHTLLSPVGLLRRHLVFFRHCERRFATMTSDLPRVTIRLDAVHVAKLKFIAEKNFRTLNAEAAKILIRY